MRYERKSYQFLLEAVQPIAHHSDVVGNQAIAFRRKVRQPDGSWAKVSVITGDTLRHALRESVAYAFLDAAGMLSDPSLSEAALRLLFAGGMITGRGDGSTVKLDAYREMCDLVPALGLLGGCAGNRCIPGRLTCEDAVLVCNETRHLVPPWTLERAGVLDTCRAHIELETRVRMDPLLDPFKRKLLTSGAASDADARLAQSEAAHDDDIATAREASKSTMLPRTFERVACGSLFSWNVEAIVTSDLEVDTFNTMVASMLANCRVGGKRATGHGLLRAIAGQWGEMSSPSERLHPLDTTALAPKVGEMFRAHVRERKDRVREWLGVVDA